MVIRVLGANLFAWAVQQARLKAFVESSWDGPSESVAELVRFAMSRSA